jgi:hypothetical protein
LNKGPGKKKLLIGKGPKDKDGNEAEGTWLLVDGEPFAKLEQIETLAAMGLSQNQIAEYMNVSIQRLFDDTEISKIVHATISRGKLKANVKVAQKLFQAATPDDISKFNLGAAIFWLKNRADWRDAIDNRHDITGTLSDIFQAGEERRKKMLLDRK